MLSKNYCAEVFLQDAKTFDQAVEVCRQKALAELIPGDFRGLRKHANGEKISDPGTHLKCLRF